MKKILFLCTGNSCRSQMAEALAKQLKPQGYVFYSAGVEKHGMNPYAVRVLQELGLDVSGQYSKTLDDLEEKNFDVVVSVCTRARENCPFLPAKENIHHEFDDPPTLCRDLQEEEQILSVYRRVRDEISEMIQAKL